MVSSGQGMYYSQTGPTELLTSSWGSTEEGTQNFPDFSDNGSAHPGDSEDFGPFTFTHGHVTPRGQGHDQDATKDFPGKWSAAASSATAPAMGGEPMRRDPSRSSTGSHRNRTIGKPAPSSSSKTRARLASAVASNLSSLEMTGNASSAFRDGPQTSGPMELSPVYLDSEVPPSHIFFHGLQMDLNMHPEDLAFPPQNLMLHHVAPAQMQLEADVVFPGNSPSCSSLGSFSNVDSRMSTPPLPEDGWSLPAGSPIESHNSSPVINGQSPSMHRTLGAHSAMMSSEDLAGSALTAIAGDDGLNLPSGLGSRRQSNEGESSARDHYLYKNATPSKDGLYHCPWENEACCNHKPEKLKCNYDKFVDSHLKPYRCKVDSCLDARFSSTACLLRHEREAHAMHGHGDKPFLCNYDGCDRAQQGNGFPRQWNLKDHMRRVHNDSGVPGQATPPLPASGPPPAPQASAPAMAPAPAPAPVSAPAATTGSASQAANGNKSTKGRKRKTDAPESTGRKASIKTMPAEAKAAVADKPMLDRWYEHKASLEDLVRGLKPEDARSLSQVQEIAGRMTKISQALASGSVKQEPAAGYRRAFGSAG